MKKKLEPVDWLGNAAIIAVTLITSYLLLATTFTWPPFKEEPNHWSDLAPGPAKIFVPGDQHVPGEGKIFDEKIPLKAPLLSLFRIDPYSFEADYPARDYYTPLTRDEYTSRIAYWIDANVGDKWHQHQTVVGYRNFEVIIQHMIAKYGAENVTYGAFKNN